METHSEGVAWGGWQHLAVREAGGLLVLRLRNWVTKEDEAVLSREEGESRCHWVEEVAGPFASEGEVEASCSSCSPLQVLEAEAGKEDLSWPGRKLC